MLYVPIRKPGTGPDDPGREDEPEHWLLFIPPRLNLDEVSDEPIEEPMPLAESAAVPPRTVVLAPRHDDEPLPLPWSSPA